MVNISVTPDNDKIIGAVTIAASPKRVFAALTDSAQLLQWWGKGGAWRCTSWENDLRVGGKWRTEWLDPAGAQFQLGGEYREIRPPSRLVYSWVFSKRGLVESLVRWELRPVKDGTEVTMTHSGLAGHPDSFADFRGGWPDVLARLKTFCDRALGASN